MLKAETRMKLEEIGISELTEIQRKAIPAIREGRDVVILAETGSGKTFAFLIPAIEVGGRNSVLILVPTRELARQIFRELKKISRKYAALVYGGVPMDRQIEDLKKSDIIIGTPGRVLDLMRRGHLDLSGLKMAVLDEFDRMLDMGFRDDVEKILSSAPPHQRVFVSATFKPEVRKFVDGAEVVAVEKSSIVPSTLEQRYVDCGSRGKMKRFMEMMRSFGGKALVFVSTRRMSRRLAEILQGRGIMAEAINGDMPQKSRERALDRFKDGRTSVLVATDVAARGIHVDDIGMVVNFDCPRDVETYIHRAGRTARQGRKGIVITFIESRDYMFFRRILRRFPEIEKVS